MQAFVWHNFGEALTAERAGFPTDVARLPTRETLGGGSSGFSHAPFQARTTVTEHLACRTMLAVFGPSR
jgi:hypothetical protein